MLSHHRWTNTTFTRPHVRMKPMAVVREGHLGYGLIKRGCFAHWEGIPQVRNETPAIVRRRATLLSGGFAI